MAQKLSTLGDAKPTVLLLIALSTLPMLQGVLLAPLLAIMKQELWPGSTILLRIMMVAPALSIAILIPTFRRFADRYERRRILVVGLVIYGLCGIVALGLSDITYLIVSRLLLGCSLACIMTISVASVGDLFEATARNRLLGLQYVASTLVGMLGPVLAGLIALVDWHLTFLLYLLPLFLLHIAAGLPSPTRGSDAKLERSLKREGRPIIGVLALVTAGAGVLWLLTLQLSFHLADRGYFSPVLAGMALGTPCLSGILSGLMYPAMRRHLSLAAIAVSAFVLMGLGYGLVAIAANVPTLIAGLLLAGFGFGFNQPNCAAWLLAAASPESRGRASASLTFSTCVGQLASPLIYDPMVLAFGSAATFQLVAVGCFTIAACTFLLSRRTRVEMRSSG